MRSNGRGVGRVGALLVGAAVLAGCGGPLESADREDPGTQEQDEDPGAEVDVEDPRAEVEGEVAFASPWHADGTTEGHDIMVTDGEGARYLTKSPATDAWPAWSPDGRQLAFASDRESPGDIFVLREDGQLDNLTASDVRDAEPAWSPDGERIAFVRYEDEDGQMVEASDVWVVEADGSAPRNLTDDPSAIDAHPSWSPDGERLVFASTREGQVQLWVLEVDSGELHNLSEPSQPDGHVFDAFPAWSPDGEHIAFVSNREAVADVWLMDPDGQGLQRLTDEQRYETGPLAWSPDGQRLAAASNRADERAQGVEESAERSRESMAADARFQWYHATVMMPLTATTGGMSVFPVDDDGERRWLTPAQLYGVAPTWRAEEDTDVPLAAAEVGEETEVGPRPEMEISADITIDGEPIDRRRGGMSCQSVMLDLPDARERGQHERHLRIEPDDAGQTATIRLEMPFREGENSEVEDDGIRRIAENVDTIEFEPSRVQGTATLEPEFPDFNNAEPVEITFDIKCGYRGD